MKRPISISIIGWYLLVSCVVSIVGVALTVHNPITQELMHKNLLSIPIQYALIAIHLVITFACGIGMLKAQNWSRLLYVISTVIILGISFISTQVRHAMIPGIIFFIILTIFLFLPKANAYFQKSIV